MGLGAGTDAPVIPLQEEFVAEYNASRDEIELVLEVVDADAAYDFLNTQIAAGNAPDIAGPLGIKGAASFPGAWLDLAPLAEATNYDLSDFDPALVEFWKIDGVQIGLPFAVFPSFFFVNLDLFDEAGLPYPPQEFGAPYVDADGNEKEWNMDTLRELGMLLTVDANGNDANSPDFDSENIVQFGFGSQWNDLRARAAMFGPGNLVDDEGNAVFPEHWLTAMKWYHDGYWKDWFTPNGVYASSDMLGGGMYFQTGNIPWSIPISGTRSAARWSSRRRWSACRFCAERRTGLPSRRRTCVCVVRVKSWGGGSTGFRSFAWPTCRTTLIFSK